VAPTTAFNVETVEHKNVKFQVWDLAGQKGIRPYWRSYYPDTKAVVFVIDATDREKLATAKEELLLILEEEELKGVPVLVFANKQDLPKPLTQAEIIEEMGLTNTKNRQWAVHPSSALTGEGIENGMSWLVDVINTPPA
jgi:ADP-ribosylation factor-like protein 1